ncbi:MAG: hypothetical protein EA350_00050 [Gemmatimonadales bacterium]|nr:MAG: hypothetical protein EA350_00050 [Gemmatimonadales bacterium]
MMPPFNSRYRIVLLLLILGGGILAGCASTLASPRGPDPFASSTGGHFFLEVRNTLEEDVTIRLRAGRHSQDLGAVSARTMIRLTVPWDDHGRLSVQIEPMTGSRFTFPPREVGNGEALELVIQNPLSSSRFGR